MVRVVMPLVLLVIRMVVVVLVMASAAGPAKTPVITAAASISAMIIHSAAAAAAAVIVGALEALTAEIAATVVVARISAAVKTAPATAASAIKSASRPVMIAAERAIATSGGVHSPSSSAVTAGAIPVTGRGIVCRSIAGVTGVRFAPTAGRFGIRSAFLALFLV
jgi:hypothetical protein